MIKKFVIACGGTGGHLAPGIALAQKLTGEGHSCYLFISRKQVDTRLIKKYKDLNYVPVHGVGLSSNPFRLAKFLFTLFRNILYTYNWLRKWRPDAVVAFGGFISVGVVLSAFLLRIPIVLHEANRKPGRTINLMRRLASRIYLPEGIQLRGVRPSKIKYFGYPVRDEIYKHDTAEARLALELVPSGKLVVLIGGSQGASVFNEWVLDNFKKLALEGIHVYCITGPMQGTDGFIVEQSRTGQKILATFKSFSDQISEVLSAADLVITRAGAGSIAEIIRCRVPSILVPYPHAVDDHQHANALFFERQAGGVLLHQDKMHKLFDEVKEMLGNGWLLERFRQNLAKLDEINSADLIKRDLLEICSKEKERGWFGSGKFA
jgi:UDP-N-acetylglucosamine--N-acetylmuramyl-(pentapeptide) pyrophosphoryl-undecaprenol N-acetylglucosamine transferase